MIYTLFFYTFLTIQMSFRLMEIRSLMIVKAGWDVSQTTTLLLNYCKDLISINRKFIWIVKKVYKKNDDDPKYCQH